MSAPFGPSELAEARELRRMLRPDESFAPLGGEARVSGTWAADVVRDIGT